MKKECPKLLKDRNTFHTFFGSDFKRILSPDFDGPVTTSSTGDIYFCIPLGCFPGLACLEFLTKIANWPILPTREHLPMSEDIFGCQNFEENGADFSWTETQTQHNPALYKTAPALTAENCWPTLRNANGVRNLMVCAPEGEKGTQRNCAFIKYKSTIFICRKPQS